MKINENTTKGKWLEIKGDVQKAWGKLTDDDLDKSNGDMKKIMLLTVINFYTGHKVNEES